MLSTFSQVTVECKYSLCNLLLLPLIETASLDTYIYIRCVFVYMISHISGGTERSVTDYARDCFSSGNLIPAVPFAIQI